MSLLILPPEEKRFGDNHSGISVGEQGLEVGCHSAHSVCILIHSPSVQDGTPAPNPVCVIQVQYTSAFPFIESKHPYSARGV